MSVYRLGAHQAAAKMTATATKKGREPRKMAPVLKRLRLGLNVDRTFTLFSSIFYCPFSALRCSASASISKPTILRKLEWEGTQFAGEIRRE